MSKVTYNQNGYCGQSMSIRARAAYADGEMPASKWTKITMVQALRDWCDDADRVFDESVAKMRKADIFADLFYNSSWHHTGKFANCTDFYSIDEDAAEDRFPEMTAEQVAAREAARAAEEARRADALAALEADRADAAAYTAEHGFSPRSIAAALVVCPERCRVWKTRKGAIRIGVRPVDGSWRDREGVEVTATVAAAWNTSATFNSFDARKPETYRFLAVRAEGDFTTSNQGCQDTRLGIETPALWTAKAAELGL